MPQTDAAAVALAREDDNDAALVAIARKESDPVLKREIVNRLSHSRSKIATDYMLEILGDK